ncbi:hypothetical protein Ais01nite_73460 [Asanoa ishikariensis]|uniref:Uncharacterized protein n=1 Tax=Asanoa ishikariensis TaxID=137265 RepID=A0A1H3URF1_9ACTN|nr:hypothetical protein Ais01nite_73460 [Asanoa ishikariensis]SDZ64918.1 hypothetical protein SAMN05421684_7874 [Asanoa ishikariensis]
MPQAEALGLGREQRKEGGEVKTASWHSILSSVHHNETRCNTGNNIEPENRRSGTGGKPLCRECAAL